MERVVGPIQYLTISNLSVLLSLCTLSSVDPVIHFLNGVLPALQPLIAPSCSMRMTPFIPVNLPIQPVLSAVKASFSRWMSRNR